MAAISTRKSECWPTTHVVDAEGMFCMADPIMAHVSKPGFEQMCNFVAVSSVRDYEDAIKQLVLQCFVILPEDTFHEAKQLSEAVEVLFGLRFPEHQIEQAIDGLLQDQMLLRPVGTGLVIQPQLRGERQAAIQTAQDLESKVRDEWLETVALSSPALPFDRVWKALSDYLAQAFRRHGMQAIALLDPNTGTGLDQAEKLSSLLNAALEANVEREYHQDARAAISNFLAEAGKHSNRS